MKSITELPPDDLALREKLPAMRPSTRERLLIWAIAQAAVHQPTMPWLLKRGHLYWERAEVRGQRGEQVTRLCDATAALDLLRWRIEAGDDREAVEHLDEVRTENEEVRMEKAERIPARISPSTSQ